MKFDEEPNYAKLISFFESLIEPVTSLRPIRIDGALKVPIHILACMCFQNNIDFLTSTPLV